MMEFNCYISERDLVTDIQELSFQIEGFNGFLFAPIIEDVSELVNVIKVMKSMNLLVKKIEPLKLSIDDEITYYIWYYKKNQLRLVK